MSKVKTTTTGLTAKQEEQLNALYICSDMLGQAWESLGYAFHKDLAPEYKQMTDAIDAYEQKLSGLIKPLKAMKQV